MLYAITDAGPVRLATIGWRERHVYIQVRSAGTLRIAAQRTTLLARRSGQDQGIHIVAGDGILRFPWRGELWAISTSGTVYVVVEVV